MINHIVHLSHVASIWYIYIIQKHINCTVLLAVRPCSRVRVPVNELLVASLCMFMFTYAIFCSISWLVVCVTLVFSYKWHTNVLLQRYDHHYQVILYSKCIIMISSILEQVHYAKVVGGHNILCSLIIQRRMFVLIIKNTTEI